MAHLLRGAALVNRREGQESRQAGSGCAAVNPGQLERGQRKRKVLRAGDKSALLRFHEHCSNTGAVECLEHLVLCGSPLMAVALS